MDPKWQFILFLLAFICFIVAAFWTNIVAIASDHVQPPRVDLVALGLAIVDFVYLYTAMKAL